MISVKCPFCGATIKINRATNTQKCVACGNEFLLEHNEEINEQTLIDNGNIFLDFKEYKKATTCFEKACEIAPDNYAVWIGLAKAETDGFSIFNNNNFFNAEKYIEHALSVAQEEEMKVIEKEIVPFVNEKNRRMKEARAKRRQVEITSATFALYTMCFLSCVVINIWTAINADTTIFWRAVTGIILSGITFFLSYVICMTLDLIKPKTILGIFLYFLVIIITIAIIVGFCLYLSHLI